MHLKDDGDDVFAFNFLSAQRVMSALSDISAAGLDSAGDSRLQTFPAPPRLREAELRGSSTPLAVKASSRLHRTCSSAP